MLPPILLLVVIYLTCVDKIDLDTYNIKIELTADKADTLVFYWPDRSGDYDESLSQTITYPSGASNHDSHLVLASFKNRLRIDPGLLTNTITIIKLTFERFGISEIMSGEELGKNIVSSNSASSTITDQGLKIHFQEGDAQIILKNYPKPLPQLSLLICLTIALLSGCVISVFLARRFLQDENFVFRFNIVMGPCSLFALGWALRWPLYLMLPISMFFSYAILYVVIAGIRLRKEKRLLLQVKPLLVSATFLALLVVPMLMTLSPKTKFIKASSAAVADILNSDDFEEGQSRVRAAIDKFEESFKYRFPFKKDLINLNATIKIFGLGFSPTSKAILGKDGMFFEGYGQRRIESDTIGSFDNVTDYMGLIPFTESELEEWLICLEERYYWLKTQGIDYVFALAPTKALVYPEKLPAKILKMKEKINKPTRYEQLVTYLKAKSEVPVVDLRRSLLSAKEKSEKLGERDTLLYYRTDFHWNFYGSFLAYQAIMNEINRAYPKYGFRVTPLDEFTIHKKTNWAHRLFINALGLDPLEHLNETYLTFHPKTGSIYNEIGEFAEEGINDYSMPKYLKERYGKQKTRIRILENRNGQTSSIFVIGDSFAEQYMGFVSGHAQQTVNFRTVYSFFPDLFTQFSPDLVIQEVLNMYLLQQPPSNVESIKQARVKALAKKKSGKTVVLPE